MLKHFYTDEHGATAIEYGLIAALVAVVIIPSLIALGEYGLKATFGYVLLCGFGKGTAAPGSC